MTINIPNKNEHSVYPGEYIPTPEAESMLLKLKDSCLGAACQHDYNLHEFEDYFSLNLEMPGLRKEEILIYVHDKIVSILVRSRNLPDAEGEDTKFQEQHMQLPENSDLGFAHAEYLDGVLKLYIPKAVNSSATISCQIVVY